MSLLLISLPNELMILSAVAVAGGLYLFVRGFSVLARKRLLLNTPTSKIRSASLGLVEIGGLATGPYTMSAPITGKACFLYQTTIWQQRESGKDHNWEKVAEESLHIPFFLDDGTGQLLIAPDSAELDLHSDFREEYSSSFFSTLDGIPATVSNFLSRHGVEPRRKIRVEERCVKPKNALFIVGTLAENPGIEVRPSALPTGKRPGSLWKSNGTRHSQIASQEIVRLSEHAASTPVDMTQQSKIAAALTKAGITSAGAWSAAGVPYQSVTIEEAPIVTEVSVGGNTHTDKPEVQSTFDLAPPVVLMKGENSPAFVISWRSQQDFVRSLAWKSSGMIWGGAALALLGIYILLAQVKLL